MRKRHVAIVTALPPSRTTLSEYGHHLVQALHDAPEVGEVTVLAEDHPTGGTYETSDRMRVVPAWRFNSLLTPLRLVQALRREQPDIAVFNLHFSSFGSSRPAAALGLFAPLLARLAGITTVTVLHNIVETVDLEAAGFRYGRIAQRAMRAMGTLLTWVVLRSHVVTTTMPRYVEILRRKYRADNVVLVPHGAFEIPPPPPARDELGRRRILTFGKFGTYKKVEPLIDAVKRLQETREVELVIAGTDSPNAPGYLAAVEADHGGPGITFAGYVPEADVPATFLGSAITVFPYTSTTGSSGVLHQAGSYGCAAVLPDIGDLADLLAEEGYAGELFEPGEDGSLAEALARLLDDPDRCDEIGIENYYASCGIPIGDVASWILFHSGAVA
ncbi:MAG: glycosyltransferase [Acidimicrobiia bacterium]|nr:glycosyltransferase [Acidimicrobiia bacterium]MBT8194248.1 glycosyltransferase [Acidimicrobiia bacterium]NNL12279.1 glycosyltransferase [Acidimicrobiia bacterium]NNL70584.1 glycosyltransferase [Acidimicrobiia bacterium]